MSPLQNTSADMPEMPIQELLFEVFCYPILSGKQAKLGNSDKCHFTISHVWAVSM